MPSCVDGRDVAGVQPAVGVEHLGGRVRAVQIALHDLRAADQQLAGLARALDGRVDVAPVSGRPAWPRCSASSSPTVERSMSSRSSGDRVRHRARLGHAVALADRAVQPSRRPPTRARRRGARRPRRSTLIDDRSYWSTSGCFARATAIGGAMNTQVVRCSCTTRRNSVEVEPRHRDERGALARARSSAARSCRRCGRTAAPRARGRRRPRRSSSGTGSTFATRLRCVSITPFGRPVVPEEYGSTARCSAGSNDDLRSGVAFAEESRQ